MPNPWLQIPLRDYEGHMSHAAVAQAQMLGATLQRAVSAFRPASLAILGAAGGNGLERVDPATVHRVVALDFNPEFLALCTARSARRFAHYEAVLHDLRDGVPSFEPVDLVYAGLVLEYLDPRPLWDWLPSVLSPRGVFVALLQLPSSELPEVSHSPFTSLNRLESVFHFVDPETVRAAMTSGGFFCCAEEVLRLDSGKEFHHAVFCRNGNSPSLPFAAQSGVRNPRISRHAEP